MASGTSPSPRQPIFPTNQFRRMDVINFISKTPGLPDAPITRQDQTYQPGDVHFACGPRLHEYLLELGKILKEYNAFSVGEMPSVHDPKEILNAVGFERGELNMIFHFEMYFLIPILSSLPLPTLTAHAKTSQCRHGPRTPWEILPETVGDEDPERHSKQMATIHARQRRLERPVS